MRAESPAAELLDHTLVDPDTGFATRQAWEEAFRNEDRRLARYGRAVTVLVAELDGLDALAARLGQGPADRLIPPVAAAMRGNARAADILARVGHTRFVALLPETDEVAAINYIERVRSACDMWLAAGAVAVRLAIGWAQPPAGGTLGDALRLADNRLNGDRRRQGGSTRPIEDVQAADSSDARRVPASAPLVAARDASGPYPDPASFVPSPATGPVRTFTPAGASGPLAAARSVRFEDGLAALLHDPGATATISDPASIANDEQAQG